MSMGSNRGGEDEIVSEINMTPLIDIMLVLLIIFMVSSSAALESGLDVSLPETNAVSDKSDKILVISLTKEGVIAVGGDVTSKEVLREKVTDQLKALNTESVILEGDGASSLSSAFEVMDIARAAGAKNFSIGAKLK